MDDDTLKNDPAFKLLIKLTLPSFLIVFVSASYSITDGIFIGRKFGILGNSAFSYIFIIYMLVFSISSLFSQGASSLISIKLGKNDIKGAEEILGISTWLSIIVGAIQSILIYVFFPQIIKLFGVDQEYIGYINRYFIVFLFGAPIYFLNHTFISCIRSQAIIKKVLIYSIVSFFTNIILNPVFIFVFDLGFEGSALATVLANLASCILCYRHFIDKKSKLKLKIANIRFDRKCSADIVEMGGPAFLTNIISTFILVFYNEIANSYGGSSGLAAMSIALSIYRYIFSILNAITNGMQPVVCYNYGAKRNERVLEGLKYSIIIGCTLSMLFFIAIQIFSKNIIGIFSNSYDQDFIVLASESLRLFTLCLPLQGVVNMGTAFFQYIEQAKLATFIVIIRQIIIQIPLALLLPMYFGIYGLWHSFWLADLLIFIVVTFMLSLKIKQLKFVDSGLLLNNEKIK